MGVLKRSARDQQQRLHRLTTPTQHHQNVNGCRPDSADQNHTHPGNMCPTHHCQSSMSAQTDCVGIATFCQRGAECNFCHHSSGGGGAGMVYRGQCREESRGEGGWRRRRKAKDQLNLRSSYLPIVLLVHMMCTLICNCTPIGILTVGAFGFSHLPSKRQPMNLQRQQKSKCPIISTKSTYSLLMSTESDNSPTTTTSSSDGVINPASTPTTSSSTNEYSFFDEAIIYTRAGSGGQGSSTYRKGVNNQNGPPDGGNGGKGGNVILEMDDSLNTLAGLARYAWRPNSFGGGGGAKKRSSSAGGGGGGETSTRVLSFRAENGADGKRQNKAGRSAKDVIVRVPPGTVVQEEIMPDDSDEPIYFDLGTITPANPMLQVAMGGEGGEGSAAGKLQRGVKLARTPPQGGERKRLKLTLKVVADCALVAVPNAGKSTLLSKVTRAKPKIADYPFTTVVPNLGVWVPSNSQAYDDDDDIEYDANGNPIGGNSKSLILCDIPGLIAGASEGIGLGHAFLRHVERCHVILHLLDATSPKVLDEYTMINRELLNYGTGKLATMPQVVVVNKLDIAFDNGNDIVDDIDGKEEVAKRPFKSKEELEQKLQEVMPHSRLMWISAKEEDGVDDLMERVAVFVKKVKSAIAAEEERKMRAAEEEEEE